MGEKKGTLMEDMERLTSAMGDNIKSRRLKHQARAFHRLRLALTLVVALLLGWGAISLIVGTGYGDTRDAIDKFNEKKYRDSIHQNELYDSLYEVFSERYRKPLKKIK